ncbi:MAG: hypothetical protein ACYDA1_05410 [Vulcanimicrobiaceae bacterium]
MRAHVTEAEKCLSETRSFPTVRASFEKQYFDQSLVQQFIDSDFHLMHTDDYPHIVVHIALISGSITVASGSQHVFMLPFAVTWHGEQKLYDPEIPHSLAALLPVNVANRHRLEKHSLLTNWANSVCWSASVRDAQNRLGRTAALRLAARYDLKVESFSHESPDDLDSFTLVATDGRDPRILAVVQTTSKEAATDFALTQRRMSLIHQIPWLQHQLDLTPDARIDISPGRGWYFRFDPPQFRNMNHPHAAALLEANPHPMQVEMGENDGNRLYSQWYILPNKTMILDNFQPGMPPFPFAPGGYDKLPLIGPIPSPHLSYPGEYVDPYVAGLIVYPDGHIEIVSPQVVYEPWLGEVDVRQSLPPKVLASDCR